jgi:hypothetical protein
MLATDDDVAKGIVASELSLAENVKEPAALSVTCTVLVPLASENVPGSDALPSVDVSTTEFVIVVTRFQELSHARTVTLNGTPTVWLWGAPLLPVSGSRRGRFARQQYLKFRVRSGQRRLRRQHGCGGH